MPYDDAGPLRRLADRLDVQELVDRYLAGLDDAEFDDAWARSIFTEDGRFQFMMGGHDGVAGMAEYTAAMMGKWRRTHHVAAGHLVEIDGDRARVRGSLIATHLHPHEATPEQPPGQPGAHGRPGAPEPFQVGDRFEGEAVRTDAGWRFARLAFEVVWTRGTPPVRVDVHDS
ncbi:nuclear transport factor 2 family protein [Streptomyces sp. NBC_00576]|uniref:nuclear transport factor 2 family protein n=1 Tax=Streptomyces sp. NBC_00576 TaxID=2903665 RepID=UPI002E7FD498|nr:nuclear transport factor 2 family protein [Streptomyces sp. NBC_00576]WUB73450.1 nuclear transport factor 2 family protein [Streptomyces sp. NBC_00576]